jgi:hypothetical protein
MSKHNYSGFRKSCDGKYKLTYPSIDEANRPIPGNALQTIISAMKTKHPAVANGNEPFFRCILPQISKKCFIHKSADHNLIDKGYKN